MPPTAEQGEPVGAAPVDEKLAETLEEIGTVDTFDVGQIHVSVGYGGEWYGWYACNTFWEGGDALNLPSHTFLLCIFCLHPVFSSHFLNLRVTLGSTVCRGMCGKCKVPQIPPAVVPQNGYCRKTVSVCGISFLLTKLCSLTSCYTSIIFNI